MAGVQQGDPLGPVLFSLVILELIDEIGLLEGLHLSLWYLDDGTYIGIRKSLSQALMLKSEFWSVSKSKNCKIFWPSGNQTFSEIDSDVRRIHTSVYGAELLGSPIVHVSLEDFFIKYLATTEWSKRLQIKPPTSNHFFSSFLDLILA